MRLFFLLEKAKQNVRATCCIKRAKPCSEVVRNSVPPRTDELYMTIADKFDGREKGTASLIKKEKKKGVQEAGEFDRFPSCS